MEKKDHLHVQHKFTLTNPNATTTNRAGRRARKAEARKTKNHIGSIQKALAKKK